MRILFNHLFIIYFIFQSSAVLHSQSFYNLAPKGQIKELSSEMDAMNYLGIFLDPDIQDQNQSLKPHLIIPNVNSKNSFFVFMLENKTITIYSFETEKDKATEINSIFNGKDITSFSFTNRSNSLSAANILPYLPGKTLPGIIQSLHYGDFFLKKVFSNLHNEPVVESAWRKSYNKAHGTPQAKIRNYLDRLNQKFNISNSDSRSLEIENIREKMYELFIIKPEDVLEKHFERLKRLAREEGRGDIEITLEIRKQEIEVIIADQKSTLDNWINYFTHPDSDAYPEWAKYWVFRGMLQLSTFDKDKHKFLKRNKNTVAPFPDLNREALAFVVDIIDKKARGQEIKTDDPEFESIFRSEQFAKLYVYAIEKVTPTEKHELEKVEGNWVKYPQGSDHMPLVKSLQGYGTGWCTAGETTAQKQLSAGDFYVYYSNDKEGKSTIPRVAIRMQGIQISEVRGIAHEQNLDPYVTDVVNKKLNTFPDGEKYKKKLEHMTRLTEIEAKQSKEIELDRNELKFLYEMEETIEGFGYKIDPRIDEIKTKRKNRIKKDYAIIYNVEEHQVITNLSELQDDTRVYIGIENFVADENTTENEIQKLGEIIGLTTSITNLNQEIKNTITTWKGSLYHTSIRSLDLPSLQTIGGTIKAYKAKSINFPVLERVGGNLDVSGTVFVDIPNLKKVGKSMDVSNATTIKMPLLESVEEKMNAGDVRALDLPSLQRVGGTIDAYRAMSLNLPVLERVEGNLDAKYARSLDLPVLQKVEGFMNVPNAESLDLPVLQYIGEELDARNALSLNLPSLQSIGEDLAAFSATSLDLSALQSVGKNLYAKKAESLNLPALQTVGTDLSALVAISLNLPVLQSVGRNLYANSTSSLDCPYLLRVGGSLEAARATYLNLPSLQTVGGELYLSSFFYFERRTDKILLIKTSA